MVRAAAKNHAHVGVVVDPADYATVLDELRADRRAVGGDPAAPGPRGVRRHVRLRRRHRRLAGRHRRADDRRRRLPATLTVRLERAQDLRYGENPHQHAARYRRVGRRVVGPRRAARRQGAELPQPVRRRGGVAPGPPLRRAGVRHRQARQPVRGRRRRRHRHRVRAGQRVRPGQRLRRHRRRQPAAVGGAGRRPGAGVHRGRRGPRLRGGRPRHADGEAEPAGAHRRRPRRRSRSTSGRSTAACSCRQPDPVATDPAAWWVVTDARADARAVGRPRFAWTVCAAVSSNAIVLAKDRQAFGIGAGQQNRVDSARIAAARADGRAKGGACASDAYFPFRDGLDVAADAGVTRGDPARWQHPRRRGDRGRRRARPRDGLHR